MKVSIIGSGSWGTALAIKSVLAGNETYLYCRTEMVAENLKLDKENKTYLPGVPLPPSLHISHSLDEVMKNSNIVLLVTPSICVRSTVDTLKPSITKSTIVVLASKGLERSSGKLLTTVVEDVLGNTMKGLVVLSGPNHAEEIGRDLPAASTVASTDLSVATIVQEALHGGNFRIYTNDDVIGIELAAATKNVIALAAGIADGLFLGDNCKALLLTRGLHEMTRFGVALGAKPETYAGLAGMGDLVATCISEHSRNRAAGQQLADGKSMDYIMNHSNMVVEGFFAVSIIRDVAIKHNIDMPITNALYEILYEGKPPSIALDELMNRNSKVESH